MTEFQKFAMELVGLNPDFYKPKNTDCQFSCIRDMSDIEVKAIDSEFNALASRNESLYGLFLLNEKMRPHQFIIELMRGYKNTSL